MERKFGRYIAELVSAGLFLSSSSWKESKVKLTAMVGIYAGDSNNLSMRSCLPQIYDMEKTHGSVVRGIRKPNKFFSLFYYHS